MYPSYGIYRNLYCFTDILQKFQSSGGKSFLTISCINMSCCKIISSQTFCFQSIFYRVDRTSDLLETSKLSLIFFQQKYWQMNIWMVQFFCYIYISMQYAGNLISLTDFQYLLCQTRIFFLRQILFPQNNRLRMKAAYTLDLFCKGTLTQGAVGHCNYIFIRIFLHFRGTHNHS